MGDVTPPGDSERCPRHDDAFGGSDISAAEVPVANKRRSVRVLVTCLLAAGAAMIVPALASAACAERATERPFMPWVDPMAYALAPNGHFESTAGWTLTGGARLVSGNEPYYVHDDDDAYSLALPSGSSARSPWMCVNLLDATLRLFVRNTGSSLSLLNIDVLYRDASGRTQSLRVMSAAGLPSWQPSLPVLFLENATSVLSLDDLTTEVAFRFAPTGGLLTSGSWRIDDFYVDPIYLWG